MPQTTSNSIATNCMKRSAKVREDAINRAAQAKKRVLAASLKFLEHGDGLNRRRPYAMLTVGKLLMIAQYQHAIGQQTRRRLAPGCSW